MEFLESSLQVQKSLGRKTRAKRGIFFTPKTLRDIVLSKIQITPRNVLDPTCGSAEFLVDCSQGWNLQMTSYLSQGPIYLRQTFIILTSWHGKRMTNLTLSLETPRL